MFLEIFNVEVEKEKGLSLKNSSFSSISFEEESSIVFFELFLSDDGLSSIILSLSNETNTKKLIKNREK